MFKSYWICYHCHAIVDKGMFVVECQVGVETIEKLDDRKDFIRRNSYVNVCCRFHAKLFTMGIGPLEYEQAKRLGSNPPKTHKEDSLPPTLLWYNQSITVEYLS